MRNEFYSDFDRQALQPRQREDYRSAFQRERDRIIHSSALRRLQAKTQVFYAGEYDFYRTRLTHSIEVAQIGRSICNFLRHTSKLLREDFFIDPDLVEAVCLAHDLGHPPFGHSGESTLNRLMQTEGGFEGNAQTLRILTETMYADQSGRRGMNPSRALLDGVLKYKSTIAAYTEPDRYFLYEDQARYVEFVFDGTPPPASLEPGGTLNKFRSLECQIMDWADDTAYSLNDIVDGINARFITIARLEHWASHNELAPAQAGLVVNMLDTIRRGNAERTFSRKIGDFILACSLKERRNFMSPQTQRYRLGLAIEDDAWMEANLYKRIASDIVFDSPQLRQLRYKWNRILEKVFTAFAEVYAEAQDPDNRLLPDAVHTELLSASTRDERMRLVCDHVAGMTDGFAIRTYKRLFDPGFGSFLDLI